MSNPGMAWEAARRDGDAVVPAGWTDLHADEREQFRDERSERVRSLGAQPLLFADRGARAARLLERTEQRP